MMTLEDLSYRVLPMVKPGRALADSEWTTLKCAAEVLTRGAAAQLTADRIADNVESFLISGRSRRAWRVRVLLTLMEFLPVAFYGQRFNRMSCDDRRRMMEEHMVGGRHLWGVCAKIRVLVFMGIYGDERVQPAMGFVPVSLRRRSDAERNPVHSIGLTQ